MRYCMLSMSPEEESLYVFAFYDGCCICLLCLKMHIVGKLCKYVVSLNGESHTFRL